ncbi:glycosyltransferase [Rhizobium halophilum]|uniref:glycosyltransferase n=1 Tax=Rhizobium halophilum TaxID=2846852 RepID=UPI001EFCB012|nr:glycosyltransferase [Rhizobium halophilum]MCF6368143.1 glycosyltransferase [Rhizobium halophilum]
MQDARLPEQPVQLSSGSARRSPELSVIVPTFNEAPNVELVVQALVASLRGIDWEVIFVDDDSSDGTTDAVRLIARRDGRVRCIRRIGRRGLAGASIEGMLSSSAPVIAIMDGDMQHDASLLPEMFRRLQAGDDLVIASRFCDSGSAADGFSRTRLSGSRVATRLARMFLHIDVSDPMSGFFAIRRPAFEALAPRLSTQGFKILMDILASTPQPLRTSEMPLHFRARQHGVSKLDNLVAAEFLSLLLAKLTGDALSLRFVLFALIGGFGVVVHLVTLKIALASGLTFWLAQMTAAYVAMTGNFFLNNVLTYRDRRLKGWRLLSGLASFWVVCSIGVIANVGVGQLVHEQASRWWLAGLAGAGLGAVFNYVATSIFTWRAR